VKILVPGETLKGVGAYIKRASAQKAPQPIRAAPPAAPPRIEAPSRAR
jgi:hypothetical protein